MLAYYDYHGCGSRCSVNIQYLTFTLSHSHEVLRGQCARCVYTCVSCNVLVRCLMLVSCSVGDVIHAKFCSVSCYG